MPRAVNVEQPLPQEGLQQQDLLHRITTQLDNLSINLIQGARP